MKVIKVKSPAGSKFFVFVANLFFHHPLPVVAEGHEEEQKNFPSGGQTFEKFDPSSPRL